MSQIRLNTHGPATLLPLHSTSGQPGSPRLLHIGVHNSANRNAGDTLLFPVVRKAFDTVIGPFDWELRQAWETLEPADAQRINQEFDGIVLGGGGLLLRDQAGSDVSRSGWQWNSSVAAVQALQIPLLVFAIGYNRFRGQADFDPVFTQHIQAVVRQSAFFGLRNSGSIQALQSYLPAIDVPRLHRQFCPTTALWQLYPQYQSMAEHHDAKGARVLAFNAAFDRAEHRFGLQAAQVLGGVAQAVRTAQDRGWTIVLAAHKTMDREIEPYLDASGVRYTTEDLTDAGPEAIMAFYAQVDFAFGMRGHAQMIPLGLRRPILSIISHDKMRFLLDDINRPTWGVEIDAPDMAQRLVQALHRLDNERQAVHREIAYSQSYIWDETQANLRHLLQALPHAS